MIVWTREVHADALQDSLKPRIQPRTSGKAANQEAGLRKQVLVRQKGTADEVIDLPSLSLRPPSVVHGLHR